MTETYEYSVQENENVPVEGSVPVTQMSDQMRLLRAELAKDIARGAVLALQGAPGAYQAFPQYVDNFRYVEGMAFWVSPAVDNLADATLAVANGAALAIRRTPDERVAAGDMLAGRLYRVVYRSGGQDAAYWHLMGWVSLSDYLLAAQVPDILKADEFPELRGAVDAERDDVYLRIVKTDDEDGNSPGDANYTDTFVVNLQDLHKRLRAFPDDAAGGFLRLPEADGNGDIGAMIWQTLDSALVNAPEVADAGEGDVLEVAPPAEQGENPSRLQYIGKAALLTALKGMVGFPQVLDVRVFTGVGATIYNAPANARRFFAILTGGGGGGGGGATGITGQAGGTAFGWWTENGQTAFTISVGGGGGVNTNNHGSQSRIQVGGGTRLLAHGGGTSYAPNNDNQNGTGGNFGSGALFHVRGGLGADSNAGQVEAGGASFWGQMGAYGAGGGEYDNQNNASVGGGQGIAIIVAMG